MRSFVKWLFGVKETPPVATAVVIQGFSLPMAELQPGDVIVLSYPGEMHPAMAESLKESLARMINLKRNPAVILEEGLQLGVLKQGQVLTDEEYEAFRTAIPDPPKPPEPPEPPPGRLMKDGKFIGNLL